MKKNVKIISMVLAMCTMVSMMAACGGNKSEPANSSTAAVESSAAASTSTVAATTTEAPKEPVTLRMLYWADGEQKTIVEETCKKFTDKNPNIIIKPEAKPADLTFDALLATLVASNNLPDCGYMGEGDAVRYFEKGTLLDLTDMFKNNEINKKLDSITIKTADGKIIGAGLSNQFMMMYYNKDLFDKAKVEYPAATMDKAWDWDKFVSVAKQLTTDKSGKHPGESGFNASKISTYGVHFNFLFQFSYMWAMNSNGGGTVSPDLKTILWDKPESAEALQKLANLWLVDKVAPVPGSNQGAAMGGVDQALLSNKVAMYISGSWDIANAGKAKNESNLKYGMAVLPKMKDAITMNCGAPMVIYKATKYPEETKAFYKYMMDPEQVIDIIKTGAWLPNEEKWYTDPALLEKWITAPNFTEESKTVLADYAMKGTVQWPAYSCAPWNRMVKITDPAMDPVWAGKKTAAAAIKEFLPNIKPIFDSGKANE